MIPPGLLIATGAATLFVLALAGAPAAVGSLAGSLIGIGLVGARGGAS